MTTTFSARQYELAYPDGIESHWWTMARSRIVAEAITHYATKYAPVLEIGCGRGAAVDNLRRLGVEAFGCELAAVHAMPEVADYVKTAIDATALPAEERQRYHVLLLLDVIEHLPEPAEFICSLAAAFPRAGLLIVTVPAAQELWSNYDEFYGHQRRYSLTMLAQLAARLNSQLLYGSYFFHALYLPARLLTLVGKNRRTKIAAPRSSQLWLHRMMALAMRLEYTLLPKSVKGTSAIACFRLADGVN